MVAGSVSRVPSSKTTLPEIKALCPKDPSGAFIVGLVGAVFPVGLVVVLRPGDLLCAEAKTVKVRLRKVQQLT